MKRRRDNILNQPVTKKPDVSTSTDLRSKIGAKLQTLLLANRNETLKRRRAFLLGEPQHQSQIVIDPTIVVKTEAPETVESNESPAIDSTNFLSSAKTRITELLSKQQSGSNKYKNSEKENSNSKCHPVSTVNCSTSSADTVQNQTSCKNQSISCNSLSKRKKLSNNKNSLDASSDVLVNPAHLKNMEVVVEDVKRKRTRSNNSLPKKSLHETCSSSPKSSSKTKTSSIRKQNKNKTAKDHVAKEASNSSAACDTDSCTIIGCNTSLSQSCRVLKSTGSVSLNGNSKFNSSKSKSLKSLKDCSLLLDVVDLGEVLIAPGESTKLCSNPNEDNSELIDDPEVIERNISLSNNSLVLNNESHDPDVVLLCEKRPTHEVITLEDGDDSDDIVEEVQKCTQCGKAFRAKSLLNFHIRMHGSDMSSSSWSSVIRLQS